MSTWEQISAESSSYLMHLCRIADTCNVLVLIYKYVIWKDVLYACS